MLISPLAGVMVAVRVTGAPMVARLGLTVRVVVEAAVLTVTGTMLLEEVRKLVSPAKMAVILLLPPARAEVMKVPTPLVKAMVPSVVLPSLRVTEPLDVPLAGATATTFAVNVTELPNVGEEELTVKVVVVEPWLTAWKVGAEVVPLKLMSPE